MVMHARKLPRLSDGYFDRNQPHPYQQNSSKYSKVGYNDRYNDKIRDSPNNGTSYRSESPESSRPSPRDRTYHNKASYLQRIKEREREKHDKDSSRSPKEKIKLNANREHHSTVHHNSDGNCSNSSEHRSNHIRSTTNVEEKEKEKRLQVGDWSEHISSSGKKYYYNCKTEVSQWEKPKEWIEWERQQGKLSNEWNKFKDVNHEKTVGEKHSNDRGSRSFTHCHPTGPRIHDDRHHSKSANQPSCASLARSTPLQPTDHVQRNCQQQIKEDQLRHSDRADQRSSRDHGRRECDYRSKSRKSSEDSQTQDMDISSDSTPPGSQSDSQSQTPVSFSNQSTQQPNLASQQTPPSVGSTSLANLPRLLSQLTGSKGLPIHEKQEQLSAHEALQTLQTALLLTRQVTLAQTSLPGQSPHSVCPQPDLSPFPTQRSPVPASSQSQSQTPSYTCADAKIRTEEERDKGRTSPSSEYSHKSSRRDSPTSSISSLQGITSTGMTSLASAALRPATLTLSSSLANYFREDLLGHIMGWQADHAERQVGSKLRQSTANRSARVPSSDGTDGPLGGKGLGPMAWQDLVALNANKYSEEAHNLGSLTCTKVSAELKSARSLVRVSEIQATLQEQRILFLRQQIKELEDWKSQNSFMCDS